MCVIVTSVWIYVKSSSTSLLKYKFICVFFSINAKGDRKLLGSALIERSRLLVVLSSIDRACVMKSLTSSDESNITLFGSVIGKKSNQILGFETSMQLVGIQSLRHQQIKTLTYLLHC